MYANLAVELVRGDGPVTERWAAHHVEVTPEGEVFIHTDLNVDGESDYAKLGPRRRVRVPYGSRLSITPDF